MTICYHMVKIDGVETLCIGGLLVEDEDNPGMLWLTNAQGERLLHVHHSNCRVITRDEAEARLKVLHAKKIAEGANLEALCIKTGETVALEPGPKPAPKPFPAFPEPPSKPWNN